ncbi:MAG: hypothetical protein ACLPHP_10540 [Candidatus Sulfotelmatobacter sp.]
MQNAAFRRRRRAKIVLVVVLLGIASVAIPAVRRPILRTAGWMLIVNDPIEPADVIVVTVAADGAGVLEAADLVHSGVATSVAVFSEPPDTVEREFIRRGIPYEDVAARSVGQLRALGLDAIDLIPTYVDGSEDEGPALADWCDQHRFRSVVVVATSDHSRRLRRVLHRSMKGHLTRVTVRSARYSVFDPDRWWQSHVGIRTEVAELEKLLRDVVRHPIS